MSSKSSGATRPRRHSQRDPGVRDRHIDTVEPLGVPATAQHDASWSATSTSKLAARWLGAGLLEVPPLDLHFGERGGY